MKITQKKIEDNFLLYYPKNTYQHVRKKPLKKNSMQKPHLKIKIKKKLFYYI